MENMKEYTCALCKQTFQQEDDFTEEKALAKYVQEFGPQALLDEQVLLCHDCYQELIEWKRRVPNDPTRN
jgi:hypothetical protein